MDKNSGGSVVSMLEDLFGKLPALPSSAVDVLVKITPWLALIFGVLGVLGALAGLGILTAFAPFAIAGGVGSYGLGFVAAAGLGISSVMMLLAFSGLRAQKAGGWSLLFWSEVVNIAASLIGISVGSIIGALIAFYLLFQIKTRYK